MSCSREAVRIKFFIPLVPNDGYDPSLSDRESDVLPLDKFGSAPLPGIEPGLIRLTGGRINQLC